MNVPEFLPEWQAVPIGGGLYRPAVRRFAGKPFRIVPKSITYTCPIQAAKAAKQYLLETLNPRIRAATAPEDADPLGISPWLENRASEAARAEQQAFGTIFRKGRAITVERRKARA